jgi:hypothetical protein
MDRVNKPALIILTLALLIMVMPIVKAQHPAVKDFYKHYKNDKDVHHIDIDGSIFKLMSWVTSWDNEDQDSQAINRIANNLEGLNIVVVPKKLEGTYSFKDVKKQVEKDRFSELMNVREKGSLISFYAQGEEKAMRDMIIFIDEEETYSIISVRGVLNMDDLKYLAENHGSLN